MTDAKRCSGGHKHASVVMHCYEINETNSWLMSKQLGPAALWKQLWDGSALTFDTLWTFRIACC